jgi:hypothetical protein
MWRRCFPCPHTTKLCSGEGQRILIDGGAFGELRSETGLKVIFRQRNDGFASVESSRTRYAAFSGSGEPHRDRILWPTLLDWQDRHIIPVNKSAK